MDRQTLETLHRAAHVVLRTKTGQQAAKAVGATAIAVATPLLATPAAPLVIAGAYLGGKTLWKWLRS